MGTSTPTGKGKAIATGSEKGGVGKTTTIANLATMLTLMGLRVLVLDLNPDGGLTMSLGYLKDQFAISAYEVILDEAKETRSRTWQQAIVQTWVNPETKGFFDPNLRENPADPASPTKLEALRARGVTPMKGPLLAPISNGAVHADSELKSAAPMTWFLSLRKALQSILPHVDYALIDTNPSASCLCAVGLCAADFFYVPVVPELLSLNGMVGLFKTVRQSKEVANPGLSLAGIVFTKVQNYRGHRTIMAQVQETLAAEYPDLVISFFETTIQQSKDGVDASSDRSVAVVHRPYSEHAISYWRFLSEMLQKVGGPAIALMPDIMRGIGDHMEKQRLASQTRRDEREARAAQES
jgi:chromosome partitioning protein